MFSSLRLLYLLMLPLASLPLHAATDLVPAAPNVAARAYLLVDQNSGHVITEKNTDKRIEPASLTKIMTAYVVMYEMEQGSIKSEDLVRISKKARYMKGSRMFVEMNSQVKFSDLMLGLVIQSGNDAAVALAEHTAGSEETFVDIMNKHAERLGMLNSHFVNSTGLPDPQHYTTVGDLAKLTRAMIHDFPEHYESYKIKEFTYNGIRQSNRNRLLWKDNRVDGVKTGHTESAGYCLIASAVRKDMRLISVVVGTKSEGARETASRKLLNYGFRFFETHKLREANTPLTEMRIWKGESETLPLGLVKDLYITTPRGSSKKLTARMDVDATIIAPAFKGKQYGSVEVMLGDKLISSRPLIALDDVAEGGIWRRTIDSIKLMFK